jgi:hypothetical protein
MTAPDDTKLQVNFGPNGPLVNVYAVDEQELRQLLAGLEEVWEDITATGNLYAALRAVAGLAKNGPTGPADGGGPPPAQAGYNPDGPPPGVEPQFCAHGAMNWKEGISQRTGNPYKMFVCAQGVDTCKPKFPARGR